MSIERNPISSYPTDYPEGDPVNAWGVYLEYQEMTGNIPREAVDSLYQSVEVPEDIPDALERISKFSQSN